MIIKFLIYIACISNLNSSVDCSIQIGKWQDHAILKRVAQWPSCPKVDEKLMEIVVTHKRQMRSGGQRNE